MSRAIITNELILFDYFRILFTCLHEGVKFPDKMQALWGAENMGAAFCYCHQPDKFNPMTFLTEFLQFAKFRLGANQLSVPRSVVIPRTIGNKKPSCACLIQHARLHANRFGYHRLYYMKSAVLYGLQGRHIKHPIALRDQAIIPAATVLFVASSITIKEPLAWLSL